MPAPETATRNDTSNDQLRARVAAKRHEVCAYLQAARRRRRRLVRVTIVGGAVATALTAAPALGGRSLADWLTATFALQAPSWQILCAIAAACSLAATVATQLGKADNADERIVHAQRAAVALEELEIELTSGDPAPDDAAARYVECVRGLSFMAGLGAA